jgi:hypothetical protein
MSFSADNGYTPADIVAILTSIMAGINTQFGTSYTYDTFIGTNFYKYFYALAQRVQTNEIKTSEIFTTLQQYFDEINAEIDRPVATAPGILQELNQAGYVASVKAPIDADAGKVYICVNVDSGAAGYAATKLAINTIIKNSIAAGIISQGTESSTITLTNGQSFAFKYGLPNKITPKWKLTIVTSENNQLLISTTDEVKATLIANFTAKYSLGKDLEPQRYFSLVDAPWAASALLQYSLDGGSTWLSAVIQAAYNDLYAMNLADITLVES